MRIQPRQQILDIWSAMLSACYRDEKWHWDGVLGANSISDSEQLLCLLYPATEIESFALDRPEAMSDDVKIVLEAFGGQARIGITVLGLVEEYLARNTDPDGLPRFDAGSYLRATADREPTAAQHTLEVVDGYSMSVTLCIAALGFARVFDRWARTERRKDVSARIAELSTGLSTRLTAAMTGLVRSFVVNTASPRSPSGKAMLGMLNQSGQPEKVVVDAVSRSLDRVRARLRNDVTLGRAPESELDDEDLLFECGWSWGVVQGADPVDFVPDAIGSSVGYADPRPYLYFTITALDGINDVLSQRTRELDLLDDTQYRLAEALRIRWDITQRYWATVARFGSGTWPLEDIPWRTSDGEESDYFSLIVSAVLIQELVARTASDDDLTRAIGIFDELARRGRIIRRPTQDDPSVSLHHPGVRMTLRGSELVEGGGPRLEWIASDFAPVLLKRSLQAARLSGNITARDRLMELAKKVMDHLDLRMITEGDAAGLWDDPGAAFGAAARAGQTLPSWYMTERVIECLVTADRTYREAPLRSPAMVVRAVELLNEAEHLLNQEMLNVSVEDTSANRIALDGVEQQLARARDVVNLQPGTAFTLASAALIELDRLAYARLDAMRST
ncbi:SCO2524 family protein [Nocardia asteroides]|nr:SCO2524 family protein [Nocardia asteroides]UGT49775.1 SCO2524 family protein [Nocardia asteroides]